MDADPTDSEYHASTRRPHRGYRNARFSTATRAGEDEEPWMARDEEFEVLPGRRVWTGRTRRSGLPSAALRNRVGYRVPAAGQDPVRHAKAGWWESLP
jgi:hypothetical protein